MEYQRKVRGVLADPNHPNPVGQRAFFTTTGKVVQSARWLRLGMRPRQTRAGIRSAGVTEIYDDGAIVCGPDRLEIRSYYFPFGTKTVPYTRVQGLQRIEITGLWSGKWRLWGTGNPRYWANLDRRRPKKKVGFVIDLGRAVSPIVTPDEPDAFESVLRDRADLAAGNARPMKGPFI